MDCTFHDVFGKSQCKTWSTENSSSINVIWDEWGAVGQLDYPSKPKKGYSFAKIYSNCEGF